MGDIMDKTDLGNRMKESESIYDKRVHYMEYMVVRLDGHGFSKLTKRFKKPFSNDFKLMMNGVCQMLFDRFNPKSIYTQSDEITMIFPPSYKVDHKTGKVENNQIYGGRVNKVNSLMGSYASVCFNKFLDDPKTIATFDCRAFGEPTVIEAFNAVLWRTRDCVKNSKLSFGQSMMSHNRMIGMDTRVIVDTCINEFGKDWNELPGIHKYGTFFVKEEVMLEHAEYGSFKRHKVKMDHFKLNFSEENVMMLCGPEVNDKVERKCPLLSKLLTIHEECSTDIDTDVGKYTKASWGEGEIVPADVCDSIPTSTGEIPDGGDIIPHDRICNMLNSNTQLFTIDSTKIINILNNSFSHHGMLSHTITPFVVDIKDLVSRMVIFPKNDEEVLDIMIKQLDYLGVDYELVDTTIITADDVLTWHGSDHDMFELAELMVELLNGETSIEECRSNIIDLTC